MNVIFLNNSSICPSHLELNDIVNITFVVLLSVGMEGLDCIEIFYKGLGETGECVVAMR